MSVEDQLDCRLGRIGVVEKLEEFERPVHHVRRLDDASSRSSAAKVLRCRNGLCELVEKRFNYMASSFVTDSTGHAHTIPISSSDTVLSSITLPHA